ncbi:MAG: sigma factor-like helix-turn-helix DNA-binding protein [Anaerotignum sp.]
MGWKAYVKGELDSDKGRMKLRLLDWGDAMERCGRRQEEMKRIQKLREEQKRLLERNDAPEVAKMLEEIDRAYAEDMEKLQQEILGIYEKKRHLDGLLGRLTEEEQAYIRMRYEKGCGFDFIGMKLHMSRATVFRMQDRILEKLMQLEKDETT